MIKGRYLVEVYDKYVKRIIWEFVDDHVVEEGFEHEDLGLQGFDLNLFNEERDGYTSIEKKLLIY